jgi:hypothetical protein
MNSMDRQIFVGRRVIPPARPPEIVAQTARVKNLRRNPLATPEPIEDWSPKTLKEKLIKIGAKVVSHARCLAFQMAEVAIPRDLFAEILRMIGELRPPPLTSMAQSVRAS